MAEPRQSEINSFHSVQILLASYYKTWSYKSYNPHFINHRYILVLVYIFSFRYLFLLFIVLSYIFLGILSPTLTSFIQYEVSFKRLQFLWLWQLPQNVTGTCFYSFMRGFVLTYLVFLSCPRTKKLDKYKTLKNRNMYL